MVCGPRVNESRAAAVGGVKMSEILSPVRLAALCVLVMTEASIASGAVVSSGSYAAGALYVSDLTGDSNASASLDLSSATPSARAVLLFVMGDTFNLDATVQDQMSGYFIEPAVSCTFGCPYALPVALQRSLQSMSGFLILNESFAVIVFPLVPWYDSGNGEEAYLYVSGSVTTSQQSIGPVTLLLPGPGREQIVAWEVIIIIITLITLVVDPPSVVDFQILVGLLIIPCAHSSSAQLTVGLWRLLAPFGFSHPLTPETVLGSGIVQMLVAILLWGWGNLVLDSSFQSAPLWLSRWWFAALCLSFFPSNVAAWLCMTQNQSVISVFFGVFGFALCGLGMAAAATAWYHYHRHVGRFALYPWATHRIRLKHILHPTGYWSKDILDVEGGGAIRHSSATSKLSSAMWPMIFSFPLSVILGSSPGDPGSCSAVYALASAHLIMCVLALCLIRRRRHFFVNVMDASVMIGLTTIAIGGSVYAEDSTSTTPLATYAGFGIVLFFGALRTAFFVWLWAAEDAMTRTAQLTVGPLPLTSLAKLDN